MSAACFLRALPVPFSGCVSALDLPFICLSDAGSDPFYYLGLDNHDYPLLLVVMQILNTPGFFLPWELLPQVHIGMHL